MPKRIAEQRNLSPTLRQCELDQIQWVTARFSSIRPLPRTPGGARRLDDAVPSTPVSVGKCLSFENCPSHVAPDGIGETA